MGYGRGVTGGDPTRVYIVDTTSGRSTGSGNRGSLRRALESDERWWIVFDVDGEIVFDPEDVEARGNKTIDGRGRDITLNGSLRFRDVQNVIITDVRLTHDRHLGVCGQTGDVIAVTGRAGATPGEFTARRFWFHHLELFEGGDGLIDLRGATDVTISWSHFHDHSKGMLMWKDKDNRRADEMQVTMHHNLVERLTVRGPRFHYGRLHNFNNVVFEWYDHGAGCMDEAQCLFQGNVWQARDRCSLQSILLQQCLDPAPCGDNDGGSPHTALVTDDGDGPGFTKSEGDLLLNGAELDLRDTARVTFTPGYPFTVEPATEALRDRVRTHVGPRTTMCR